MTDKPEALRLAERFEEVLGPSKTTRELRRLCEINQELVDALSEMVEMMDSGDEHGAGSPWHKKAKAALRKARGEKDE